jgi:hypothetical protein
MEMKMQIITAILSIALLFWIDAASAQSTYSVSVSIHTRLPQLTEDEIKGLLDKASKMLQKNSGHVDTPDSVACNVAFILKGPVRTFGSPDPHGSPDTPEMVDEDHVDTVHRVDSDVDADFHVKVVNRITNFCRVPYPMGFNGCSFPPNFRSIIVVHPETHADLANPSSNLPKGAYPDHLLWAHEFGHLTGLGHRDEPRALMTPCNLGKQFHHVPDDRVQVTPDECRCLLSGLGSCPLPRPILKSVSCR